LQQSADSVVGFNQPYAIEAEFDSDNTCSELNKLIKTVDDQNVANLGKLGTLFCK